MGKKELKKRYRELESELNRIVLRWDPYALYEQTQQADEFSYEVQRVLAKLPRAHSEGDVLEIVQQIFSEAFSPEDFPREACSSVATEIWQWWQQRGTQGATGHA
jgi:hypothetical protein